MLRNRQFSLSTLLLLVAIGLLSVSSQAQLPAKRVSRFGRNRDAQPIAASPSPAPQQGARPPSGISLSFGMVDFPRSPDSTAFGVNSKGDIVGIYGPNLPTWEGETQSYLLEGDTFHKIGFPGAPYTSAFGINKKREIVGWYYDASGDGTWHAFLKKGENYTNIDYPGADNTAAVNINDAGEVIGIYFQNSGGFVHAFALSKGVYTTINSPLSYDIDPGGINSSGVVVGTYLDENSDCHGFVFQHGQVSTVDYPGATNTILTGINDAGQIVGEFGGNVLINGLDWEAPNIFLLNQGTFTPLSLPVADAQVTWSYTLNGDQLVGFYVDSLGNIQGYTATISQ
jgi:hypothetical protein